MTFFRSSLKVLEKIIRRMPKRERFIVLLLAGIIFASFVRVLIPAFSEIPKTLGSTVYSEGLIGTPKLINPVFADFNDVDRDIGSLIFSGLLKYDPQKQNFIPDLAESIQRSKDNRTYLATLKKNILWHDGKPVTSDDIVFTFQKVIQDAGFKNPILKSSFENVVVQKIDNLSVSFTLKESNSYFISYLTTGLLPFHILKDAAVAELDKYPFNRNPVGTGPYRIINSLPSGKMASLLLQRFEKYYVDKPYFGFVRFSFFDDSTKLLESKSKFNGIPKIFRKEWGASAKNERFVFMPYRLQEYMGLFYNIESPVLSSKKLRQALSKSVDKSALTKLVQDAVPIDTIAFRRMENEWINQFDVKAAEQILKDLGYKKEADGLIKDSKGQPVTIRVLAESFPQKPTSEQKTAVTVDFVKNSWQALGLSVSVRRETGRNFMELLQKREYDVLLTGQRLGYNTDVYAFWHSSQRGVTGLNFSQLKSFRVDSLLEDLRLTFDTDKKRRKLEELEKLISDEIPALFLYTPEYGMVLDKKIQGFFVENLAYSSDRFADFYLVDNQKPVR